MIDYNPYITMSGHRFKIELANFSADYRRDIYSDKIPYEDWVQYRDISSDAEILIIYDECKDEIEVNIIDVLSRKYNIYDNGFGEFLSYRCDEEFEKSEKENENKKENDDMKGLNFDFGPCTGDNVRLSMYGIAIKNASGTWVSYNNGDIVDVDVFNFEGGKFLFKMPVAINAIEVGDIVVHNKVPMFVTNVENGIEVVDISAGEKKSIIPTKNMFGFDFVTKIVSMFNAVGNGPTADQPFGNMLPFLMMENGGDIDPMMMMLMMNGGKGNFDMSNPMMMYFLMGNKSGNSSDMLLPLMMMMK